MMVNEKKVFLKKLWLALVGDKFSELRVDYEVNGFGIRCKEIKPRLIKPGDR